MCGIFAYDFVDLYGTCIRKYTSPMDPLGVRKFYKHILATKNESRHQVCCFPGFAPTVKTWKKQAAEIWFKWRFSLLLLFLVDIPKTTWTLRNIPWRFMVGRWIYNFLLKWSLWRKGTFLHFPSMMSLQQHSQWWGDNLATKTFPMQVSHWQLKPKKNTTLQDGAPEAYYKWIYP